MNGVEHVKALIEEPEPAQPDTQAMEPVHHGKFTFTPLGLEVNGDPSYDEWAEAMKVVTVMERGLAFLAGDLIRFGEERYGEAAAQIIDARSWSPATVRAYVWLSEKVPMQNRMIDRGLSVKHHMAVAALPEKQQRKWLTKCLKDDEIWSVAKLKESMQEGGESTENGWQVVVTCTSKGQRDTLVKTLELEGFAVRTTTRYGKSTGTGE